SSDRSNLAVQRLQIRLRAPCVCQPPCLRPQRGGDRLRLAGEGRQVNSFRIAIIGLLLGPSHLLAEDLPPAEVQRKPIAIAKIDRKTPVDFEKEILPIFKNNCLACHNKTTTKAGLILETPSDILKGGESGKVVVPKHSGDSLLLKIASHQVKPLMPPKSNKVEA